MALRNPFKLYVSVDQSLTVGSEMMKPFVGYPIDNVIQIKLSEDSFKSLFKDTLMSTSVVDASERYNSEALLNRFKAFFGKTLNNYNNLASDITILVNNTFNDVDVNPVALEAACVTDGTIFDYFLKSDAQWNSNPVSVAGENVDEYGEVTGRTTSSNCLVYEMIAREIDNMISRNIASTSEDMESTSVLQPDGSFDLLDEQYTIANEAFWTSLSEGDSIFIEGSFVVPTRKTLPADYYKSIDRNGTEATYTPVGSGNLPIILQFVNSASTSYSFPQA